MSYPCGYGTSCWRPLCPFARTCSVAHVHENGQIALVEEQEHAVIPEEDEKTVDVIKERNPKHIVVETVDPPVPQVAAKILELIEDKDARQKRVKRFRVNRLLAQLPC